MTVATLAILGPLAAAIVILAFQRYPSAFASLGATTSLLAALVTLVRVAGGASFEASFPGLPEYPLRLLVDPQAALLLTVVAVVNLLVTVYAVGYMRGESGLPHFFSGLGLFAGAMQALVLAGDWILFLAAWEIIGLASYLLIGFWFDRTGIGGAATRAFLVTRSADLALYAGIAILVIAAGTTQIAATLDASGPAGLVAAALLLLAAMGKSAQVPFHGWLQSAMVGPTPVSALLHSATLVVAGVILLTRSYPLLSGDARLLVGIAGGVTVVLAGLMALAQPDLKRSLAASTSSQLGFMFLGVAAASPFAALFHLTAHAAMKSSLFLGAGIFQHARGTTDLRQLQGIGRSHPLIYLGMVVAGLALVGIPPLAGFWSKEAIIAATFHAEISWLLAPLSLAGSLLTGMYVARSLRFLWSAGEEGEPVHGLDWMAAGLAGLATLAAITGFAGFWLTELLDAEMPTSTLSLLLGTSLAVLGLVAGWIRPARYWLRSARPVVESGLRVNGGFDGLVVRPVLQLASICGRLDDHLQALVTAVGHTVSQLATRSEVESGLNTIVEQTATRTLALGRLAGFTDDSGISGAIGRLVHSVRTLGSWTRQLQTGLIHRELAATAVGALVILVLILVT